MAEKTILNKKRKHEDDNDQTPTIVPSLNDTSGPRSSKNQASPPAMLPSLNDALNPQMIPSPQYHLQTAGPFAHPISLAGIFDVYILSRDDKSQYDLINSATKQSLVMRATARPSLTTQIPSFGNHVNIPHAYTANQRTTDVCKSDRDKLLHEIGEIIAQCIKKGIFIVRVDYNSSDSLNEWTYLSQIPVIHRNFPLFLEVMAYLKDLSYYPALYVPKNALHKQYSLFISWW